jgi:hypothetical protein
MWPSNRLSNEKKRVIQDYYDKLNRQEKEDIKTGKIPQPKGLMAIVAYGFNEYETAESLEATYQQALLKNQAK